MCNKFERLKAAQVAAGIRDNERNGRAHIVIVEEGSEPKELIKVTFNAKSKLYRNIIRSFGCTYQAVHYWKQEMLFCKTTGRMHCVWCKLFSNLKQFVKPRLVYTHHFVQTKVALNIFHVTGSWYKARPCRW